MVEVDLYILDSFGGKHWVYRFPSEKEAVAFMNLNNTEKMEYVIEEVKECDGKVIKLNPSKMV